MVLMRRGARSCACALTTIYSKMAYRGYEDRPPVVATSADGEGQYYTNTQGYPNFEPVMPQPWGSMPPRAPTRPPTQDFSTQESYVPSSNVFPFGQGSTSRRSLHITTNVSSASSTDTWSQRSSGISLVPSPSSYLPPSPSVPGVPSVPRHKVVGISFNGASYVRLDLTRHVDASAVRRDMVSRVPSSASTGSNFDIFRTYPPGSDGALEDWQLMLDVEHFGDDRGTLKFLVQAADVYSNSHLSNYATTPSLLRPPYPISFSSPTPSPSLSSTVGSASWYGPHASTLNTDPPSHPLNGYPARGPSNRVSMPMPMPAPAPVQPLAELAGSSGFPIPSYSTYHPPPSPFRTPVTENPSDQPFVGRPVSMNSVVISGTMATDEVLSHLYERGCRNVTNELDEYRISQDPVARGGGGDVYSGELLTGERVALKCVRLAIGNDDRNKLKITAHELYVWSKCNHPNVLELIGVTHYRGQVAMVSPWMENGDLLTFLRLYPNADRHDLCVQITDGVAYLHSQEIVHGDIKGANVLVSQDGVAKITDFGTSALKVYTLQFAVTKSKPGLSLRWAAPEVLEEKSENSYQADVYALAMTILEAITGDVPYAHIARDCAVMNQIIGGKLPTRPEAHMISDGYYADTLWSLLNQCWAYDYRKRPTAVYIQHQMKSIVF
ncbi:kinase-like domain-containing protein [Rhizoctonia solani]|nr:kinase-like domain-containing protein [Rhizoctonia solani]